MKLRWGSFDNLVVARMIQAWTNLGVEAFPSSATLIAIVQDLRSKDRLAVVALLLTSILSCNLEENLLRIPEMEELYSRMGRQDPERDQGGGTLLRHFFGQKSLVSWPT